jgi:hypothetical protein
LNINFLKKRLVEDYTTFVVNELEMPANTVPKRIQEKILLRKHFEEGITEAF